MAKQPPSDTPSTFTNQATVPLLGAQVTSTIRQKDHKEDSDLVRFPPPPPTDTFAEKEELGRVAAASVIVAPSQDVVADNVPETNDVRWPPIATSSADAREADLRSQLLRSLEEQREEAQRVREEIRAKFAALDATRDLELAARGALCEEVQPGSCSVTAAASAPHAAPEDAPQKEDDPLGTPPSLVASPLPLPERQEGELRRSNGAVYTGQVLDGLVADGCGVQKWTSGVIYDGDWVQDAMDGEGILQTPDGSQYEGRWAKNKQQGHGIYYAPDGGRYEGQWFAGKMHGNGWYFWPDGAKFHGKFVAGERCGTGHLTYANGAQYEGEWVGSRQHGIGTFSTKDGRVRKGMWDQGRRSQWFDDDSRPSASDRPRTIAASGANNEGNARQREWRREELQDLVLPGMTFLLLTVLVLGQLFLR